MELTSLDLMTFTLIFRYTGEDASDFRGNLDFIFWLASEENKTKQLRLRELKHCMRMQRSQRNLF